MKGSELAQYMLRHGTDAKPLQHQQNYDLPYTPTSPERVLPQIKENNDLFENNSSSEPPDDDYEDSSDESNQGKRPDQMVANGKKKSESKMGKKALAKDSFQSDVKAIDIIIADDEVFKLQRAQKYQPKGVRTLDQLKNEIDQVCSDDPNQRFKVEPQNHDQMDVLNNKIKSGEILQELLIKKRDSTIQQDKIKLNEVMGDMNQDLVDSIKKKFTRSPSRSPRSNSQLRKFPESRNSKFSKQSIKARRKSQMDEMDDHQIQDSNNDSKFSIRSPKKSRKSRLSNSPSKLSRKWSKSDVKIVTPKPAKQVVKKNTDALTPSENVLPKIKIKSQFVQKTFTDEDEQRLWQNQILNNSSRELTGQDLNADRQTFKERPLVINVAFTQYEILTEVAKETNFKLSYDEEDKDDWDVWWIDGMILPTLLQKMANYQRVNHLPNVKVLASKNFLARNLNLMQKAMPEHYDFFPQTWVLPADAKSFKEQFTAKRAKTFIIKPEFQCQGLGIFLTRGYEWLQQGEHYVAQKYLHKPYLIDNLKFDLRIYVLVTGIAPLRAFIYKEGLARFATEEYQSPMGPNLNNLCMHLTNYAINKEQPGFQQNENPDRDDIGHKRSMTAILKHIDNARNEENELPTGDEVWDKIKDVCVKTLFSGIHSIEHLFRSSKPQDVENSLCFQIFGFDIFLDEKCKPWLIEVNHSPSFLTESPLDYNLKKNILRDSLHMLNLSWRRKNRYLNQQRNEKEKRLIDIQKLSAKQKLNEKEQVRQTKLKLKDQFENSNMGDFQNLYPLPKGVSQEQDELQNLYDIIYLKKSRYVYDETLSGGGVAKTKKEIEQKRAEHEQPDPHVLHVSPNKKGSIMRGSHAMSQTNYGKSPGKSNYKSQREKNYSLAFPLNKVGLDHADPAVTNDFAQQEFYDKLNQRIVQNEVRISQKKDQINSSSLNKIREFIENTNSQQSEYRTPKVTSDRDLDQKYFNHGLNIANITRRQKWDVTPNSTFSPNQQIEAKYKLSPRGKDFDPRLLCLPEKPNIIPNKKYLATRTNRDSHSKADNIQQNMMRVSEQYQDQIQNRTQQNFINYVGPPQELESSFHSNNNTPQMPQVYSANANLNPKHLSSAFTQPTTNVSSLSQVELSKSKSNNKFMQDAKAFANFISKNQIKNGISDSQSLKQQEQLQKFQQLKPAFSNSLKVHFPLKKQTIAQMHANKKLNGPNSFSNNLDSIISEMEVTRNEQNTSNQYQPPDIVTSQSNQYGSHLSTLQAGSSQTNNSVQIFSTIQTKDVFQHPYTQKKMVQDPRTFIQSKNVLNQKLKPLTYNSPPKTQKIHNNKHHLVMTGNSYLSPLGDQRQSKYNNQQ